MPNNKPKTEENNNTDIIEYIGKSDEGRLQFKVWTNLTQHYGIRTKCRNTKICKDYENNNVPFIFEATNKDSEINSTNITALWSEDHEVLINIKRESLSGFTANVEIKCHDEGDYQHVNNSLFKCVGFTIDSNKNITNTCAEKYDDIDSIIQHLESELKQIDKLKEFIELEGIDATSFYMLDKDALRNEAHMNLGDTLKIMNYIDNCNGK